MTSGCSLEGGFKEWNVEVVDDDAIISILNNLLLKWCFINILSHAARVSGCMFLGHNSSSWLQHIILGTPAVIRTLPYLMFCVIVCSMSSSFRNVNGDQSLKFRSSSTIPSVFLLNLLQSSLSRTCRGLSKCIRAYCVFFRYR